MTSHAFGAFLEVDSTSKVTNPPPAYYKDGWGLPRAPSTYEIDELQWGQVLTGPPSLAHSSPPGTPRINNAADLERIDLSDPGAHEAVGALKSLSSTPMNKWRLLSACLMNLTGGLNDSAPGALIPYLERDYDIGYAIVSLIFVTNAVGFIVAAACTDALETRFGRTRTYAMSLSLIAAAHVTVICRPPFPVVVACFFFIGVGLAIPLALNNVFCANLANSAGTLGALHGAYGIGGTIGPLVATAIASHGARWSFFYVITLGLTIFNIGFTSWSFWDYEKDLSTHTELALQLTPSRCENMVVESNKKQILKQAVKNRVTLLGALFIFAYQGAEVSISGWVVSFLVSHRGADVTEVGYVTAGFWAGITLGRFLLSHPAQKLGRKLSVTLLVFGSAAFQLMVWLVPNVIGGAVALAILGFLLGPIYPCAAAVFSTLLPRRIQTSSLGFVSAMGSSGGAFAPFFTGLLAQNIGTVVLHPICIGLYGAMISVWIGLPKIQKRSE
ncbi:hypothetical protein VTO42DRAFT_8916 [Malbranchea cinnamomea]